MRKSLFRASDAPWSRLGLGASSCNLMTTTEAVQAGLPEPGQIVHVRSRRCLVKKVETRDDGNSWLVRLACADDDAQGLLLNVYWDYEIDHKILAEKGWANLALHNR